MRDLPSGAALLTLARDVLLNDLMPLVPAERRLDVLLAANCMAIAERESAAGEEPAEAIRRELRVMYEPLARIAGESTERSEGGEDMAELWRRFARELRIGAFDNSPDREARARAILWGMTIAKLRLANPKFLAANGFV